MLLVVLYHLWPEVLRGGFVGVDVFFVISGYLITGHLVRESEASQSIELGRFWARRLRRLLPAALLVILVTTVAVVAWLPKILWIPFFTEAVASALYVENWALAANSVNYLSADQAPSAAQHYWSLSVEEQFYIVWPLLILLAYAVARRVGHRGTKRPLWIALGSVVAASLITSVVLTASVPSVAYFATPVRAWEFGIGGLLALVSAATRSPRLRSAVAWAGWAAIAVTGWTFSSALPFPGIVALLPVAATAAVIWAGTPGVAWAPDRIVSLRAVQWLGGVSYSAYLWHWPLIVVAPYVLGLPQLALPQKGAILLLTFVLAGLSRRFVEDPVRRMPALVQARSRRTFLVAGVAMAVVVIPSLAGGAAVRAQVAADDALRADLARTPCFGAASLDPRLSCSDADYPVISPDPSLAQEDSPDIYFTDPPCFAADTALVTCSFGDAGSDVRVALVGDSHAAQWEPALQLLAEQHGWDLHLYLKTNCAFTAADRSAAYEPCATWSDEAQRALAADGPFDLVITSFFAENLQLEIDAGVLDRAAAIAGFRTVWQPLIADGATVLVIRDTPHMRPDTTVCVAVNGDSDRCDVPRAIALADPDVQFDAAEGLPGATRLDMTDWVCTPTVCPAVVGGVALHTDPYHLTQTYSVTVTPYLMAGLRSAVGDELAAELI